MTHTAYTLDSDSLPFYSEAWRLSRGKFWNLKSWNLVNCWSTVGFFACLFCLFVSFWKVFSQYVYVFVIRLEKAAMSMQTPAICRDLQLGAQKRTWILKCLPPQTQAAWSCSAAERGAAWSVKPPCFSSASSPRAGEEEEEEEEGHLRWHHKSVKNFRPACKRDKSTICCCTEMSIYVIHLCNKNNKIALPDKFQLFYGEMFLNCILCPYHIKYSHHSFILLDSPSDNYLWCS